jgi:hypothetical protein
MIGPPSEASSRIERSLYGNPFAIIPIHLTRGADFQLPKNCEVSPSTFP